MGRQPIHRSTDRHLRRQMPDLLFPFRDLQSPSQSPEMSTSIDSVLSTKGQPPSGVESRYGCLQLFFGGNRARLHKPYVVAVQLSNPGELQSSQVRFFGQSVPLVVSISRSNSRPECERVNNPPQL